MDKYAVKKIKDIILKLQAAFKGVSLAWPSTPADPCWPLLAPVVDEIHARVFVSCLYNLSGWR